MLKGKDPRVALREQAALTAAAISDIHRRLVAMDQRSAQGAWTERVLRLIAKHPGRPARELANLRGRETVLFKAQVRKLKELGLTESLTIGYRFSPRGRKVLGALK